MFYKKKKKKNRKLYIESVNISMNVTLYRFSRIYVVAKQRDFKF